MITWKKDKTLGYMYSTNVNHPNASINGKIYEHVYLMSQCIGRALDAATCYDQLNFSGRVIWVNTF